MDDKEVSLSIEETNRLRASLGLKPLRMETEKGTEKGTETAEKVVSVPTTRTRRDRSSKDVEERELDGKTLFEEMESTGETKTATSEWVSKSREMRKRARAEPSSASSRRKSRKVVDASYTIDESSIVLGHDMDAFEGGEGTILTLRDEDMLAGDEESGDDDGKKSEETAGMVVLEDQGIKEKEKSAWLRRSKRAKGSAVAGGSLLPQYDDDNLSFVPSKTFLGSQKKSIGSVSSDVKVLTGGKGVQLGSSEAPRVASDVMTPDELKAQKGASRSRTRSRLRSRAKHMQLRKKTSELAQNGEDRGTFEASMGDWRVGADEDEDNEDDMEEEGEVGGKEKEKEEAAKKMKTRDHGTRHARMEQRKLAESRRALLKQHRFRHAQRTSGMSRVEGDESASRNEALRVEMDVGIDESAAEEKVERVMRGQSIRFGQVEKDVVVGGDRLGENGDGDEEEEEEYKVKVERTSDGVDDNGGSKNEHVDGRNEEVFQETYEFVKRLDVVRRRLEQSQSEMDDQMNESRIHDGNEGEDATKWDADQSMDASHIPDQKQEPQGKFEEKGTSEEKQEEEETGPVEKRRERPGRVSLLKGALDGVAAKDHITIIDDVPLTSRGVAQILGRLRRHGEFRAVDRVDLGGRQRAKVDEIESAEDKGAKASIRLEYLDEFGRPMSLKEAYRYQSHFFHGARPGKVRQDKRLREYKQQITQQRLQTGDGAAKLLSQKALLTAQRATELPYLVLEGKDQGNLGSAVRSGVSGTEKTASDEIVPPTVAGIKLRKTGLKFKKKPTK
eukprot:TRINITY_DN2209_c0_g2_i1.p1 TRINITY_DN2209_c0_g2~~TRINITY_DN2209_c0_g2_i1.p1  ORF type:complete len:786 (+),score=283.06 TRINITY_DN2209_c0_g2_i1:94-2451(+)